MSTASHCKRRSNCALGKASSDSVVSRNFLITPDSKKGDVRIHWEGFELDGVAIVPHDVRGLEENLQKIDVGESPLALRLAIPFLIQTIQYVYEL